MSRATIDAVVIRNDSGDSLVASPAPGKIRWQRLVGEVLRPGSRLGFLMQGQIAFDLILPEGATGQVEEIFLPDPWTACTYGQQLGKLAIPSGMDELAAPSAAAGVDESGLYTLPSPTHGTFYRRPSPDSPPYVEVGQEISPGDTLGLVEVMKCFSPIQFEPPAGYQRGIVRELIAADGAEVPTESPLLRIELL